MKNKDLEKVNTRFRHLTDLFFFTDRTDIDLSDFKILLKSNYNIHYEYLWDRYLKSSQIYWNSDFWNDRISYLLSLNDTNIYKSLEKYIERNFFNSLKTKNFNVNYDTALIQFLELCRIKKSKNLSLHDVYYYCLNMPEYFKSKRIIDIISMFIPNLFSSLDEYAYMLHSKCSTSPRSIQVILDFEKLGYKIDKSYLSDLLIRYAHNSKKTINFAKLFTIKNVFFKLISDPFLLENLKINYTNECKENILMLAHAATYKELEENYFLNIKNIIKIDSSLTNEIANLYLEKLYSRYTSHNMANIDRIMKLLKLVPEISERQILLWLSSANKFKDLKYFLKYFPELNKLSAFA